MNVATGRSTLSGRSASSRFAADRRGAKRTAASDRRQLRLNGPCPALVQGVDASGQSFRNAVIFDNVSAGGAYMRCKSDLPVGHSLFVVFALTTPTPRLNNSVQGRGSTKSRPNSHGPKIAARAVVRRVDRHPDGAYGVAVMFSQQRFL